MRGSGLRAKRAYLKVEKHDKFGRPYIGQDDVIAGAGMFSAKEAEIALQHAADNSTARVVDAGLEVYTSREIAPFEGNPRRLNPTETVFGGFQNASWLPESPRVKAINARREESQG